MKNNHQCLGTDLASVDLVMPAVTVFASLVLLGASEAEWGGTHSRLAMRPCAMPLSLSGVLGWMNKLFECLNVIFNGITMNNSLCQTLSQSLLPKPQLIIST